MTFSDSNARNHKLTFPRVRPGAHAFISTMNVALENALDGLRPALFGAHTVGASSDLGDLYYMLGSGLYDKALDLGPADRSQRTGLVYCVGATGAGSIFDASFFVQGSVRTAVNHGVTPGTYGYLSKTTPGLFVANEGATSGFSDAFDPNNPILVGTYLPGNLFSFHPVLVFE